ncbi:hypothetical protein H0H92_001026 [Tricholoma furcatifolium]|nr:hypothetical protein H0H92_001026 [Tricholoma furcatifolium]
MATTENESFDALRAAIVQKPPFCQGTVALKDGDATIFYKEEGNSARWLDLSCSSEDDVAHLATACERATFGLNQENVLDEAYRKAGKMDTEKFSTKFDPIRLQIVDRVHEQLLEGDNEKKSIDCQLYKLNVYGKDSFFKAHKDTPRGETMFGSLVVVFPTPHEGGALVLRHFGQEWTFNSSALTQGHDQPTVAYIAFYSDIEHEVSLVTSGYRVTLTYNLFLDSKSWKENLPPTITPVGPDDQVLQAALTEALANPNFLPYGGHIGFGLHFAYPIQVNGRTSLKETVKLLKGTDAVINRVCGLLSLDTTLNAVYEDKTRRTRPKFLVDEILPGNDTRCNHGVEDLAEILCWEPYEGRVFHAPEELIPRDYGYYREPDALTLWWVIPLTTYSRFRSMYTTYGNEPSIGYVYGDLCIVAKVGPPGNRETKHPSASSVSRSTK